MRSQILLVLAFWLQSSYGVHAAKTWATLPVRCPPAIDDTAEFIHATDVLLGTPPQNMTMIVNIAVQSLYALVPDCVFCPPEGMYDPTYSTSATVNPSLGMFGDWSSGGTRGNETVTLDGVLQDIGSPITFLEHMSSDFYPRFNGGILCLLVNQTKRSQSILVRLDEQGQLLNPVWGLRMAGGNGTLTIGAPDLNEYEGEINWVPAIEEEPTIQVDALKGYQGNVLPLDYPVNATMDSLIRDIYLRDIDMYMLDRSYLGVDSINVYPPYNLTFGVGCQDQVPTVPFSVGINESLLSWRGYALWCDITAKTERERREKSETQEDEAGTESRLCAGPDEVQWTGREKAAAKGELGEERYT